MSSKEKVRRPRRWLRTVAIVLVAFVGLSILALRVFLNGERLARLVQSQLNQRIRGRVEVGSIEWSLRDLPALLTGGDIHLELSDVKVFDAPEDPSDPAQKEDQVIAIKKATLDLDSGAAIFGRHDLLLKHIKIVDGGYAKIKQVRQPYPVHEFDKHAVSLTTAFMGKDKPSFRAGIDAKPSLFIDLEDYELEDVDMDFVFPDANWTAEARGARGKGFLSFDGRDPLAPKLYYDLSPTATAATVKIKTTEKMPIEIAVNGVDVPILRQLPMGWPDETIARAFEYQATATTVEGAGLKVDGKLFHTFTDVFGGEHDLALELRHAGKLINRLSGGLAGGDDLAVTFRLRGPGLAPEYHVQLADLAVALPLAEDRPPLDLALDRLTFSWNDATASGYFEDTVARGAGGEVQLSATFNRKPDTGDLHVRVSRPVELAPFLPAEVARLLGTQLSGRFHVFGTWDDQRLDGLDLRLGRGRITGAVDRTADGLLHANGLELAVGGTVLRRIDGTVAPRTGDVALDLLLDSTDPDRWLRLFGKPALVHAVAGSVHVEGRKADLTARATLAATGVPIVDRVDAEVGYRGGVVDVREAESSVLGGWLRGSGKLVLGPRPSLESVEAQGVNLDLGKLPGLGALLGGEVDVSATASGPLDRPRGEAVAEIRRLTVAGEAYDDTRIVARAAPGAPASLTADLRRKAGGELTLNALWDDGELGGVLDLRKLPLEAVTALAGAPGLVGGRLDAALTLSGTAGAPTADGTVEITRGWFKEAFLGSAGVTLERVGPGRIRVTGHLFQGRAEIAGVIATAAPFASDVTLTLRRLELDLFAPEMSRKHGVRGWISGEVHFKGDLSLARPGQIELSAHLSEAVVVLDSEDPSGRPRQLRVANRTPIDLAYDRGGLTLAHEVVLSGPTGDFTVSGSASTRALDVKARGKIAMSLLAPYLRRYFEQVAGELVVELHVTGSPLAPRLAGVVEVVEVAMQPAGQDTIVRIPGGKLELKDDQVSLTGLSLLVSEAGSDTASELTFAGGVRLDGFEPRMWGLRIDGQLDGKMLLVLAPQAFSSGSGSADLSIALLGSGAQPDIDGTIEFSPESPLTFVPRGARREIALTQGFVKFTDQLIELGDIQGTVDDEGDIENLAGEISLADWKPTDVDVTLDATNLPLRIPQELELTVNLRKLRFLGGEDGLDIGGTLEVVDGRYIRRFNLFTDVLKPERALAPSKPFWESNPLLARAELDLTLVSQAFFVKNNLASIGMSGQVTITGTPVRPRFNGVIRVDDGSFKFQGIRPKFERASGTVSFEPLQTFPGGTPTLDLHAEADYRDSSGQNHLIYMSLKGTLSNLDWDLKTEAGLNKTQTLQLVLAGRTPDELRASWGDTAIGKPGAVADSAAAGGSGFVYADQFVKDLSGDFFSLLIGDPLRNITDLDVVRIQLGTNAIGVHIEKDVLKSLRLSGDIEGSQRSNHLSATGQYRITDDMSIDMSATSRDFDDEAIEDEQSVSIQSTWRWVLLP